MIRLNSIVIYLFVFIVSYLIFFPIFNRVGIHISWIDEMVVLLLGVLLFSRKDAWRNKELLCCMLFMFSYLIYSLIKKENVSKAAFFDFIVFLKPCVSFYAAYLVSVNISQKMSYCLRSISLIMGAMCWLFAFSLPFFSINTRELYPISLLSALSFLYFSKESKKNYLIAFTFMLPSLLIMIFLGNNEIRSKFICEFVLFVFLFFFLRNKVKIRIKWIIAGFAVLSLMLYLNWNKFHHYFIENSDTVARTVLYKNAFVVERDYFPFGPGFGTYASEAAARYYSPLYYKYGLYQVWGLSPQSYGKTGFNFLNDTFYPILAQFGIMGVLMWILFWGKHWKEAKKKLTMHDYRLFLFAFGVMTIQCIAANTFTGAIGIPYMMIIGFVLNKKIGKNTIKEKQAYEFIEYKRNP